MFAPALPEYFINRYSNEGDLIFDPFSGRGTTALRSRELNRKFVGSDLNPYSLVLSRFKISKLKKNNLLIRLKY
jgi:site-specific DNA-methyltransferase (adenine-specific)